MNLEMLFDQAINNALMNLRVEYQSNHWDNTPMGEEWHADFLVTNPISDGNIVIQTLWFDGKDEEEQVQELHAAFERNKFYLSSGHKTLWLIEKPEDDQGFIRHTLQEMKNVNMPMFYFTTDNAIHSEFFVGGWRSNAEQETRFYADMSEMTGQLDMSDLASKITFKHHFNSDAEINYLPIEAFLMCFFMGAVRWTFEQVDSALSLALMERSCWKCKTVQNVIKTVNIVAYPFSNSSIENLKSANIKSVIYYSSLADSPLGEEELAQLNNQAMRQKYNYGLIKSRYSKTVNDEYLSTGCVKCGALQGQHYIDTITLNPQEYTHTELVPTGLFQIQDEEAYETVGEWIFVENEYLERHQHRSLEHS